jgi:hypothetical protein
VAPKSPTGTKEAKEAGPLTKLVIVEAPTVKRLSQAQLVEAASGLAKKPFKEAPKALMELTARSPFDATHGNIDVYAPGRWDTSWNLIFMDAIRQVGPSVGEWEGSAAYIYFKPPSSGTFLIVGHFTGYQTTMHLNGPWGENTAYTAKTSDSGAVTALRDASAEFEFTMHCTVPDNGYGIGYIESVQAFLFT